MRLTLVRHGQTPSNSAGLLDTDPPGPDLTDLGREQAAALPTFFADQCIDVLATSGYVRTDATAEPLRAARGLELLRLPGLREVRAGDLEMRGDPEAVQLYLQTIARWMSGEPQVRLPGGESGQDVLDRFDAGIAAVADQVERTVTDGDPGAAVVIAHGAVIRTWASIRGDNLPVGYSARRPLHNTGAIVLEGDPGAGWHVIEWAGEAVVGPELDDPGADGPAGEPIAWPGGPTGAA